MPGFSLMWICEGEPRKWDHFFCSTYDLSLPILKPSLFLNRLSQLHLSYSRFHIWKKWTWGSVETDAFLKAATSGCLMNCNFPDLCSSFGLENLMLPRSLQSSWFWWADSIQGSRNLHYRGNLVAQSLQQSYNNNDKKESTVSTYFAVFIHHFSAGIPLLKMPMQNMSNDVKPGRHEHEETE